MAEKGVPPVAENEEANTLEEPKSPHLNGEFVVVPGNNESESDSASSVCSMVDRSKSQGSSLSSFADVGIQETEALLEKGHSDDVVAKLVEDARKDVDTGVNRSGKLDSKSAKEDGRDRGQGDTLSRNRSATDGEACAEHLSNVAQLSPKSDGPRVRASTDPGSVEDEDVVIFNNITYLGSSTVNAPVSEIEFRRTMAILAEHTRVAIKVSLTVGSTLDGCIRLIDPENDTDIASYHIHRILFCGKGDDKEKDCFGFNTVHGDSDVFHCHVFRCQDPDMVSGPATLNSVNPFTPKSHQFRISPAGSITRNIAHHTVQYEEFGFSWLITVR